VIQLISLGADLDLTPFLKAMTWEYAFDSDFDELALLLIEAGAAISCESSNLVAALHYAIS